MALFLLLSLSISLSLPVSLSQPLPLPSCNAIHLSYSYLSGFIIPPNLTDTPSQQPYNFQSSLTVTNYGLSPLKSWHAFIDFQHNEYLVSVSGAVPADGTKVPGTVHGTVFAGFPVTDLKTAAETAGDVSQYRATVGLLGTQFGVGEGSVPMPKNISLANEGFICSKASTSNTTTMEVCCTEDPDFKANTTTDDQFLPRQNGDLTMMYDIISTYDENYWAQVTIENHNPLGRLDYWKLSWDWMREEFIDNMKGAYPSLVDSSPCINGPQGQYYRSKDFTNVLNCERTPILVDLPFERTNDTRLGMIPNCCRNGTILPKSMDPKKSSSVFQIQVFKMPPDLNRSEISPPQNWKIKGTLNPDYVCGPPIRVSQSQFPDSSGLPVNKTAFASWQVVCNITKPKGSSPKCCVSFSAFYNESVIPCKTCACGCATPSSRGQKLCSTSSSARLLPSQAALVPFENRTKFADAWAKMKHLPIPDPLPCGDNCGVSINWHLYTDYKKGWSSRVTIFNWDETPFADWFAAVEMGNAAPGFEKAYSFNATAFNNNVKNSDKNDTIFMKGLPGLNYIVAERDGKYPTKDPRVPGKQQSVLSFSKKNTPEINIVAGDGFPAKVFFNGEECSLPDMIPASANRKRVSVILAAVVVMLLCCV